MLYWKISSLVLQPCYTSECLFPPKSPILGCLVHFRAKVFNKHFNFKCKNSSVSPSSSVIRLSISPCQSSTTFPVFQLFLWNTVILCFGLFNRRTIKCLSREKSDTSVLKYLTLKINELSSKLRRLHQISLPFIARFEKFSSYACDVHPKFAHLR